MIDAQRVEDPFEVVLPVLDPRHEAVPQEVVEAVDIELRGDELADVAGLVAMLDRGDDSLRQPLVESRKAPMHRRRWIGKDADRPALVVLVENLLHDVGERPVSQIVEECRDAPNDPVLRRNRIALAELVEHPRHQVHHPERVGEA